MALSAAQLMTKVSGVLQRFGVDVSFISYSDPTWDASFGDSQRVETEFTARALVYDEVLRESGTEPIRRVRRRALLVGDVASVPRLGDEITVRGVTTRILEVVAHEYEGSTVSYVLELEG